MKKTNIAIEEKYRVVLENYIGIDKGTRRRGKRHLLIDL